MSGQAPLSFEMSPAEKAAQKAYVDTLNKKNFAGGRMPKSEIGKDEFLKLLTAQLSHQDPTAPMDDAQFMGQLTQLNSLQQLSAMSEGIEKLTGLLSDGNAVNAVGKRVDIDASGNTVTGYINAATRSASPEVNVNGRWYAWSAVKTVYSE